ncbi:hypothetical protein AOQ84DRAFT_286583, partial [Glonium stellatum]
CEGGLLGLGRVKGWRDLPSENWAEMMDFWHCHKPSEHHDHGHGHGGLGHGEEAGKSKGYAASNRLRAIKGTGFVDLGAFLVREEDCEGVKVSAVLEKDNQPRKLLCGSCNAEVGVEDDRAEGWRIWKWSVGLSSPLKVEKYSMQKWISAHFLALIENQGVRKFSVRSDDNKESSLLVRFPLANRTSRSCANSCKQIWIFTPDLSFSSSVARPGREDPTRAMKVFWQAVASSENSPEQQSFSVEEVAFPAPVYRALEEALRGSAELLPASARKFQGWSVGLLERFELANT